MVRITPHRFGRSKPVARKGLAAVPRRVTVSRGGIGWAHGKTCQTTADQSTSTTLTKSDGVFELGVLGEYAFGPCLVGLEVRWLMSSDTSVVFGANLGWIFGPD
jgi:hypothetical protein